MYGWLAMGRSNQGHRRHFKGAAAGFLPLDDIASRYIQQEEDRRKLRKDQRKKVTLPTVQFQTKENPPS